MDLDLEKLNEWLSQFPDRQRMDDSGKKRFLSMQKFREFCGKLDLAYKTIHVAGSKGKGTITATIGAILEESGRKVGLYMSPHVLHFTERVATPSGPFSPEIYEGAFSELRELTERAIHEGTLAKEEFTWLMLVTMFGMLCFKRAQVDYGVFEVGLGGRYDTTNVIEPNCIAMGPIELEHTQILGNTLSEIASVKAGVIKKKVPVFSAPQEMEVKNVFDTVAVKNQTKVEYVSRDGRDYLAIDNEVARLAALNELGEIPGDVSSKAIEKVRLPGRFEKICSVPGLDDLPYILLDVAHTPRSIEVVTARMKDEKLTGNLLFGCNATKAVEEMARTIVKSGLFQQIFITRPGDFKEADLARMKRAFLDAGAESVVADEDYTGMIKRAAKQSVQDRTPLMVLGSFYLAGEVKKTLGLD